MSKKPSLKDLNAQLHAPAKVEQSKPKDKPKRESRVIESHIPRGERADFLKLTITMPAPLLAGLRELGMSRKAAGQKDTDTSSLIREAVREYLSKHKT